MGNRGTWVMRKVWHSVLFDDELIVYQNGKSTLIKMPKHSDYGGFKFWVSNKLVEDMRDGRHSLLYTDDFEFKLKKYGNGRFNKFDVVEEVTIGAEEMEYNISWLTNSLFSPMLHVPDKIEPEPVEIIKELLDDEY